MRGLTLSSFAFAEDEAKLANRIAQNVARSRFLASMKNVFSGELSEEDKECIM